MSSPAPDSSLCRAAAPRLRLLQLLLPDYIDPLQLLLPDCIRFSCCSLLASASAVALRLRPLQLLLPDCVRFNCSPIASTSAVAPRLRPLQLLLPDRVRFNCCSLIAHASTAAPLLHASACNPSCSGRFQPMPRPNVLEHSLRSSRFSTLKYEGRVSLV